MIRVTAKAVPRRTKGGLIPMWENITTFLGSHAPSKCGTTGVPEVDECPFQRPTNQVAVPERIQLGLGWHHVELRRDSDPRFVQVHGPHWAHCD